MQHETAKVKKAVKKYTTKDGVEKESISVNVNLGAKSEFNDGDIVAITLIDDFDKVADISVDEITAMENTIADQDKIITANNESIANLNAELQSKLNIINDVTAKYKASEKTADKLESDISAKDKEIAELKSKLEIYEKTIADNEKRISGDGSEIDDLKNQIHDLEKTAADQDRIIDEYSAKIGKLNDSIAESKTVLLSNNSTITQLEKEIAVYDAMDIDKLKEKADEVDELKDKLIESGEKLNAKSNVISLLQNQITEYNQLVNFKDNVITALKKQSILNKLIGKDAAADITAPTLYLIDESGNLVKNDDDNIVDVDADADVDDDSGDTLTII